MQQVIQTTADVEIGDFVQYALVTDTVVLEVVDKTAKTLKLRGTQRGEVVRTDNIDGNPWPVQWTEAVPNPDGPVFKFRERKNGGFRAAETYGQVTPALIVEGVPATRVDYRF